MNKIIFEFARMFDLAENCWESREFQKKLSALLVFVFLFSLLVIQLNVMNLLPASFAGLVPKNQFDAVTLVFTLLLVKEVIDMIFSIALSVSITQMKQLKVLSLVLIRASFKSLGEFSRSTTWPQDTDLIFQMGSSAVAALLIFIVVLFYNRIHRVTRLTDDQDTRCFIAEKKMVAMGLFFGFFMIGVIDTLTGIERGDFYLSLDHFFTLFVFADIVVVLISLRYSRLYASVFRNSGFALATVLIRIAITAPPYYQEGIAVFAALFAYSVNYVYGYIISETMGVIDKTSISPAASPQGSRKGKKQAK